MHDEQRRVDEEIRQWCAKQHPHHVHLGAEPEKTPAQKLGTAAGVVVLVTVVLLCLAVLAAAVAGVVALWDWAL